MIRLWLVITALWLFVMVGLSQILIDLRAMP